MDGTAGAGPAPGVRERLLTAWRGEIQARYVYEALARRERDERRADVLRRIAEAEASHRARLEARMRPALAEATRISVRPLPQPSISV